MSMNIGSMLRALMGELQVEGVKALELRVGQIVRGVLLEMMDNHEALMNINGVQVRAKLETALPVGTGTLLQVQPGSNAGTIKLKPLADPGNFPSDEGLKDVLKSFALPDQKWSLDLMRGLKRDGFPFGKDTAAYFRAAAALKPAGMDMQSWMAAADIAFRRGLTVTQDTIGSLRQALFGPPMHEQMADLASALKAWQDTGGGKSPSAQGLAARLQALLAQGETLLAQGEAQLQAGLGEPQTTGKPGDHLRQQAAGTQAGETRLADGESAPSPVRADVGIAASLPAMTAEVNDRGKAGVVDPRRTAEQAKAVPPTVQGSVQGNKTNGHTSAANPAPDLTSVSGREAAAAPQSSAARGETVWIGRFLDWLGAGHENALLRTAVETRIPAEQEMLPGTFAVDPGDNTQSETLRTAADSLKNALLSLAAHDETPPALREAAQSLVSQITGQQLLLSSDRQPNAPYSLMTLFVPMKGQNGDTTATVHVQTRRSLRGEWDTDNCRLLFDLRMRNLGDTVVDVQVVDRIVSLKLMNDYPGMAALIDQAREEVSAGLQTAGFQLLSMTAVPLPSYQEPSAMENGEKTDKSDSTKSSAFAAKKYKGVDFRI